MSDHVIVWDLETVPDIAGYAAANGLIGKSNEEIRESLGNKFPKHIYHSIVCIGALVAHKEPDHWAVDAIGAPHVGERTEKELISTFVDKIAELTPQLVTFNGNTFDLPVLRYRAMIHAVSASGLTARPYFNRYTEDALDLCDVLSSFAPHTKASLNELSKIMGLPGKPEDIDGGEVERYFLDGRSRKSRTIVKLMSSTPIAFGCDMSYFGASCRRYSFNSANRSSANSSKLGVMRSRIWRN